MQFVLINGAYLIDNYIACTYIVNEFMTPIKVAIPTEIFQ